ncbi:MAG TPA: hypothetical protein VGD62_07205, partial [Acidobacteriaceae bacterium]
GALGRRNRLLDERYFDYHADLAPSEVARLLGGTVVWQQQRQGQWAALIHFNRSQYAASWLPAGPGRAARFAFLHRSARPAAAKL